MSVNLLYGTCNIGVNTNLKSAEARTSFWSKCINNKTRKKAVQVTKRTHYYQKSCILEANSTIKFNITQSLV